MSLSNFSYYYYVFILVLHWKQNILGQTVSGPGLLPHKIIMPARYFYVNLTAEGTESYSERMREELRVEMGGEATDGARPCRLWIDRLDRRDGSFIVRYKLYQSCLSFYIHVFYKNKHIGESPYRFDGVVRADECDCAELSLEQWMREFGCGAGSGAPDEQIARDLAPFPAVNMSALGPLIVARYHRPRTTSMCHYVVRARRLYRRCYGEHVGFNVFSDGILAWLGRRARLPDLELFVNLGDWPLVERAAAGAPPLPVWSWCGSDDHLDILMPTYDITESSLENMGRVSVDMLSVQGHARVPWSARAPVAFWRGRDSRRERLHLVDIARRHPRLFNVSLTNFFFFRDEEARYGPKTPHVSFFEFFDYKYQISVDGTVAAYRLPYLLAGGSLVLKQQSPYREHFYARLRPFVHYVPVRRDLADLVARVEWAARHDAAAARVAAAGAALARDTLHPHAVLCYHAALLSEWHKRQVGEVRVREGMVEVAPPPARAPAAPCLCDPAHAHTEL